MALTDEDLIEDFALQAGDDEIKDFSIPVKRLRFKFNGNEVYEAAPLLGGKTLAQMATVGARMEKLDTEGKLEVLGEVFDRVLLDESAARLRKRMDQSKDDPIDFVRQAVPAFKWLMENYTGKDSPPPSASSTGSGPAGTSSTAGAPPATSTPDGSPAGGSSTSSSTT